MQQASVKLPMQQRFQRGVTLIEAMIVLVIFAVLAAIAMPSMGRFVSDMRVSGATNEFVGFLSTARHEAIRRGGLATVCRTTTPEAAVPTCSNGSDWSTGWIVFAEQDATASNTVVAANLLNRHGALTTNVNAQANRAIPITFNATGEPVGNFTGITFNFNYNDGCGRAVVMSRSGRVTVTPDGTPCGN